MGLFRKKNPTTAPPAAASTDSADSAGAPADSAGPSDTTPAASASMGTTPADNGLDDLRAELAALRERLDAADREKDELASTVNALQQRLLEATPLPPLPPTPAPPPAPVDDRVAETAVMTDELRRQLTALDERVGLLDARITSVSTELAERLRRRSPA